MWISAGYPYSAPERAFKGYFPLVDNSGFSSGYPHFKKYVGNRVPVPPITGMVTAVNVEEKGSYSHFVKLPFQA